MLQKMDNASDCWGIICCEKNNLMIRLHRNFMYRIKGKEK